MIEKELARKLVPLVNSLDYPDLVEYAAYRITYLHKSIENTDDLNEILRVQGAIRELRRIFSLKDEVIADSR